jgi:hypothetical protein
VSEIPRPLTTSDMSASMAAQRSLHTKKRFGEYLIAFASRGNGTLGTNNHTWQIHDGIQDHEDLYGWMDKS